MKLTLGFSPCPNDTFIFDALVNGALDTGGLRFDPVLEDVQTLNEWALEGRLDVSKISYGVLPLVLERYAVLASGGALGQGVGPLLVSRRGLEVYHPETMTVAIPGRNTTAHLLFSLAYPQAAHKRFMVFDQIEDAVLDGAVDAGVIIHEGRFTYRAKGLRSSRTWASTGSSGPARHPARRDRGAARSRPGAPAAVEALVRGSVERALAGHPLISDYVKRHAQEMDEAVMRQHVDLYVNAFSVDLGDRGGGRCRRCSTCGNTRPRARRRRRAIRSWGRGRRVELLELPVRGERDSAGRWTAPVPARHEGLHPGGQGEVRGRRRPRAGLAGGWPERAGRGAGRPGAGRSGLTPGAAAIRRPERRSRAHLDGTSPRRRQGEVRADLLVAGRPAGGDHLAPRVEGHALRAVHVQVAEE